MSQSVMKEWKELTDSRELYEAKPHPFISIFIGLLFVVLAAALTWSYFGEMDIVVKATGVVRPNEQIGVVKNGATGRVAAIHYEAGQRVRKGDLLYTLENDAQLTQLEALSEEQSKLTTELEYLKALRTSLSEGGSDAVRLTPELQESLLGEYSGEKSLRLRIAEVETRLEQARSELSDLTLLERSATEGQNLFPREQMNYYSKYADYAYKREKLELQFRKASEQFQHTVGRTDVELEPAQRLVYEAKLALQEFENEFLLSVRGGMEEQTRAIEQLEFERSNLFLELGTTIEDGERRLIELERQLQTVELEASYTEVRAPKDGVVHATAQIGVGEWIQTGQEILSIVPEGNAEYTIELSLPNEDIANIRVGDTIRYQFYALPYKEYGELEGKLTLIGADATVNPEGTGSFYTAKASIENRPLFNYRGEEARIRVGMLCEAYIVTDSKKILYYLLEKLDLRE